MLGAKEVNTTPAWVLLAGGIVLLIAMYEFAPKWGGWILLLVVLGYLFASGAGGGRVLS